uniref:Secreted protein n=1 Tax=Amblyomma cajennense TaxID=34607 RepID=A0A023FDI0_AMBCJ
MVPASSCVMFVFGCLSVLVILPVAAVCAFTTEGQQWYLRNTHLFFTSGKCAIYAPPVFLRTCCDIFLPTCWGTCLFLFYVIAL